MGESATGTLVITNRGALNTGFEIVEAAQQDDDVADEQLSTLTYTRKGVIEAWKTVMVDFVFKPQMPTAFSRYFVVRYTDKYVPDAEIEVHVSSEKVPVYVEKPVMDFRCCVHDKLYRAALVLRNRGKTALKVLLKPPPVLQGVLTFNPDLGFVQGKDKDSGEDGTFQVAMKFRLVLLAPATHAPGAPPACVRAARV